MEEHYVRIIGSDGFLHLIVKTKGLKPNSLHFTFLNSLKAWTSTASIDFCKQLANASGNTLEEFFGESIRAFSSSETDKEFEICVDSCSDDERQVVWKKKIEKDGLSLVLGKMNLKSTNDHTLTVQLDNELKKYLITSLNNTRTELDKESTLSVRYVEERHQAVRDLKECLDAKDKLESKLYSQLLPVLNSKKQRIQQLYDEIDKLRNSGTGTSSAAVHKEVPENNSCDTDEEQEKEKDARVELKRSQSGRKSTHVESSIKNEPKMDIDKPHLPSTSEEMFIPKRKRAANKGDQIRQQSTPSRISPRKQGSNTSDSSLNSSGSNLIDKLQ